MSPANRAHDQPAFDRLGPAEALSDEVHGPQQRERGGDVTQRALHDELALFETLEKNVHLPALNNPHGV